MLPSRPGGGIRVWCAYITTNDLKLLLEKLEERFGPANMKDSFIADAKLRRKQKDETFRVWSSC